jgi:hypothetical protein
MQQLDECEQRRVLWPKADAGEGPVVLRAVGIAVPCEQEWVVNSSSLPEGDAIRQIVEEFREDGTAFDVHCVVGIQSDE